MKVNYIKHQESRCSLSITFCDEDEERVFIQKLINIFKEHFPVNCMLTDLDTDYFYYIQYFKRSNYYVFDRSTNVSIFAYELNHTEIQNVISNWGYYTIDALIAFGEFKTELKRKKLDAENELKTMPIVITQVLDFSINIIFHQIYLDEIAELIYLLKS